VNGTETRAIISQGNNIISFFYLNYKSANCTHFGGSLAEGKLEGYELQCPWHGSKFDIRSGKVTRPPAMRTEPTYEVDVEKDNILVKKLS
jgi:nitrite reductase/ring-hydroxylating ferredoxin subunit